MEKMVEIDLKEQMKEKFLEKLEEMQNREVEIRKVLSFNVEDLQDNPNMCLAEVLEYLTEHNEKIEDYWIENNVNNDTFKPELILHMRLTDEWKSKLVGGDKVHTSVWKKMIDSARVVNDDENIFKDNPHL
jgi:hypothetical protein